MSFFKLFWKKNKAREIRDLLHDIDKKIKQLKDSGKQKEVVHKIIVALKSNIGAAENDILEQAEEEKTKPWIDASFDSRIDALAKEEINALRKLGNDLDFYERLVSSGEDVNEVIELLVSEETAITARELQNQRVFDDMAARTLFMRLRSRPLSPIVGSATDIRLKTRDGISWTNIAFVAEQLGGWVKRSAGRHAFEILFPQAKRPIPVSQDAGSDMIAKEVREEVARFLPQKKLPNVHQLRRAFVAGDIRAAA